MDTARVAISHGPRHWRFSRVLARVLIGLVGIAAPLGYLALDYRAQAVETQATAQIKAELITRLINASPATWTYRLHELESLLDHYPSDDDDFHSAVYDAAGRVIARSKAPQERYAIGRSALLFDAGAVAGRVEVAHAVGGLLTGTLCAGLLGAALSGVLMLLLRAFERRERGFANATYERQARARVALHSIGEAVFTVDAQARVDFLNPAAERLVRCSAQQALGRPLAAVCRVDREGDTADALSPLLAAALRGAGEAPRQHDNLALQRRDGSRVAVEGSASSLRDRHDRVVGAVLVLRDVSSSRDLSNRLAWSATHDALTGLANRSRLHQELSDAIHAGRRQDETFALLFLDLDGFKAINDRLGHHQGDRLLQEVAVRLQQQVRELDLVVRLGGDEFCVVLRHLEDTTRSAQVAQRCLDALLEPLALGDCTVNIRCSLGIALYPGDAGDAEALLRAADTAMYAAKTSGKHRYAFYDSDIAALAQERLALEAALGGAITRAEFELHYQPQVSLTSGRMVGVEALIRWRRPGIGLVAPDDFIPVAERIGFMNTLGQWVLQHACAQAVAWRRTGLPVATMAVNISPSHFEAVGFVESVTRVLQTTGLHPQCLEIEITEAITRNPRRHAAVCQALQDLGVKVAIDDFGTGYSSLSVLKHMPIDTLKLDRQFIQDINQDSTSAVMIGTIISMASGLHFSTVAEGVETLAQVQALAALRCDVAQGYFFCRPLTADRIPAEALRNYFDGVPPRPVPASAALAQQATH